MSWTTEQLYRIRNEFPATLNVKELAKELGVRPERLREKARSMGVERDPAAMFAARSIGNKIAAKAWRRGPYAGIVAGAVAARSALEVAWGSA